MRRVGAVLAVMWTLSAPAWADEHWITIHEGFLTGQVYLDLSEAEKSGYAKGVIDGMLLAPLFGAPEDGNIDTLGNCVEGMTDEQVVAIITTELRENPEKWHQGLHTTIFNKLVTVCNL